MLVWDGSLCHAELGVGSAVEQPRLHVHRAMEQSRFGTSQGDGANAGV